LGDEEECSEAGMCIPLKLSGDALLDFVSEMMGWDAGADT